MKANDGNQNVACLVAFFRSHDALYQSVAAFGQRAVAMAQNLVEVRDNAAELHDQEVELAHRVNEHSDRRAATSNCSKVFT